MRKSIALRRTKPAFIPRFPGQVPTEVKSKDTGIYLECIDMTGKKYIVKDDTGKVFRVNQIDYIATGEKDFICENTKCKHITTIVPKPGQVTCGCKKCGWNSVIVDLQGNEDKICEPDEVHEKVKSMEGFD